MNIAIIPARAGSKRVPHKNIRDFLGRPIIAYSIEAALNAHIFERVVVSTDSESIAELSKVLGAEVPFLRSEKNSNDVATTMDVLKEVSLKLECKESDAICCLYPTAPFVTASVLTESYQHFAKGCYDSLCPIVEYEFPIQRAFQINSENRIEWIYPEHALTRSQDLRLTYHDAGQFYWLKNKYLLQNKAIVGANTGYFLIHPYQAQDIDTLEDWNVAEIKFKYLNNLF